MLYTDPSKLQAIFNSFWNEAARKPLKIATTKKILFSVNVAVSTCYGNVFYSMW